MRLLTLVSTFLIFLSITACSPTIEDPKEDIMNDVTECQVQDEIQQLNSTTTLDATTLWSHAVTCEGLQLVDNTLILVDNAEQGSIQTGMFELDPFIELVPSWNIIIDEDVKVRIKVSVGTTTTLEDPYLMGYWTDGYKVSGSSQTNTISSVSIDTILAKDEPLRYISFLIQFENGDFTFKNVSVTTKQDNTPIDVLSTNLENVNIDVPPLQQLSIPTIGSSICSPTSLTMVLQYYNHLFTPSDVAELVRDEGAKIYGNWSFNASYAGGFLDLYSRVEYINDIDIIVDYLKQGTPVILSIRTTSMDQLEGSIMSYSSGHLVVLRGLVYEDNHWVALVNDPAEYTNENVLRHYALDQLLQVWRGYAYIVQDTPFDN